MPRRLLGVSHFYPVSFLPASGVYLCREEIVREEARRVRQLGGLICIRNQARFSD